MTHQHAHNLTTPRADFMQGRNIAKSLSAIFRLYLQAHRKGRTDDTHRNHDSDPEQWPNIPRARVEYVVLVIGTMDKQTGLFIFT